MPLEQKLKQSLKELVAELLAEEPLLVSFPHPMTYLERLVTRHARGSVFKLTDSHMHR